MMVAKEVEDAIIRLGQKARAAVGFTWFSQRNASIGWCYLWSYQGQCPIRVVFL